MSLARGLYSFRPPALRRTSAVRPRRRGRARPRPLLVSVRPAQRRRPRTRTTSRRCARPWSPTRTDVRGKCQSTACGCFRRAWPNFPTSCVCSSAASDVSYVYLSIYLSIYLALYLCRSLRVCCHSAASDEQLQLILKDLYKLEEDESGRGLGDMVEAAKAAGVAGSEVGEREPGERLAPTTAAEAAKAKVRICWFEQKATSCPERNPPRCLPTRPRCQATAAGAGQTGPRSADEIVEHIVSQPALACSASLLMPHC